MLRYAITSDTFTPADAARLGAQGIDYIQLRDKRSPAAQILAEARAILRELAPFPNTRLLINSRADIAVAAGAHGVHLTSRHGELTPQQVRTLFSASEDDQGASFTRSLIAGGSQDKPQRSPQPSLPRQPTTSISCHTLEEVIRAHDLGVDLILFGPVFEKRIAGQLITDGSGLDLLHRAALAAAGTPVLALGGITHENTAACLAAGGAGIAAIRLFA